MSYYLFLICALVYDLLLTGAYLLALLIHVWLYRGHRMRMVPHQAASPKSARYQCPVDGQNENKYKLV